ncbi:MAG: hypothetical protein AB7L84_12230 [Acidimicrobiia bacterium]
MGDLDFRTHAEVVPRTVALAPSADLRVPDGAHAVLRDYFGAAQAAGDGPQAFLVEDYPVDSQLGAHFHDVDQFQVFLPAPGAYYQRTPLDAPMVHYADRYTTYGPFGSGEPGFAFLTLRRHAAAVTAFMPRSRDLLAGRPGRNRHVRVAGRDRAPADGPAGHGVEVEALFGPDPDRMAASVVTIEAGATASLAEDEGSDGRYLLVLDGTAETAEGRRLGPLSLGWSDPGGAPVVLRGGADGARVVVMQFPGRAEEDAR